MPTAAEIRAAIVATMQGITDIGQVCDYERYAARQAELVNHYAYNGQIRGWFVRRAGWRETNQDGGLRTIDNRWQIRGYMSLDDEAASEKVFDGLLEALADAFRADDTLGGVVDTLWTDAAAGLQGDDIGPVMFAGVLCHGARLALVTRHHVIGPGEF